MKYKISMSKDNFFKIHNKISCTDLAIIEDNALFNVELESYTTIKNSKIPYTLVESLKMKIYRIASKYYILLFGVCFLFSILYINTFRVNKIIFNNETPINDEIEAIIKKSYRKLFMFNFTNLNYNKLSMELKQKYIEYPFISVYSKNNNIMVDIYDEANALKKQELPCGYITAKKDAIVESFYVYRGTLEVYKNKFVKKGDMLISNQNSKVGAGLVLGYTYEKIELEVKQKETIEELTNNKQSYHQINIFNNIINLNKNEAFELCESNENVVFNLFDIFEIKKIEENEKSAIIKTNSEDEAIEIGKNRIIDIFNNNIISSREKIIDILPHNIILKDNAYKITYIVKKLESIGEFVNVENKEN